MQDTCAQSCSPGKIYGVGTLAGRSIIIMFFDHHVCLPFVIFPQCSSACLVRALNIRKEVVQRRLAFQGGQFSRSYAAAAAFVGSAKSLGILAGKMTQSSGHRKWRLARVWEDKIIDPRRKVPVQKLFYFFLRAAVSFTCSQGACPDVPVLDRQSFSKQRKKHRHNF
jgi:hypothetical protein